MVSRGWPYVTFRKNTYWDFHAVPQWFEIYCWFGKHCR